MKVTNLIPILITTLLVSACMQGAGSSNYNSNGSGISKKKSSGSSSSSSSSSNSQSEAARKAQEAKEAQQDKIAKAVERVQWNCHSIFANPENEISAACLSKWNALYRSAYGDLKAANATILACKTDLARGYADPAFPQGCKDALKPWLKS